MERNRAATCMVDKEFLATCSSYTIFTTSYLTASCETFCTATSMIGEKETLAICCFYTVFATSCETFCTATSMIDEKETRAICCFYTVFATSYFITSYEIFTTDQQSTRYRTNDRYTSITVDVKLVLILG
jgi:hypothetical protein